MWGVPGGTDCLPSGPGHAGICAETPEMGSLLLTVNTLTPARSNTPAQKGEGRTSRRQHVSIFTAPGEGRFLR